MIRTETIGNATIYLGDSREILPTLDQVDVVIADPPFGEKIHAGARGRGATTGGKHVLVDFAAITENDFISDSEFLLQITNRWVVMFADIRHCVAAEAAGLPVIRMGVWTKNDPAPQFTGDRPAAGWDAVCIMHRPGKKRWNGGGRPAVWRSGIVKNGSVHPTQKPIELVSDLVHLFSERGELILDPFMGSGTTGVASLKAGRRFIGIEIDEHHFQTARSRIAAAAAQPDLFVEQPAPPVQTSWDEMWSRPLRESNPEFER